MGEPDFIGLKTEQIQMRGKIKTVQDRWDPEDQAAMFQTAPNPCS